MSSPSASSTSPHPFHQLPTLFETTTNIKAETMTPQYTTVHARNIPPPSKMHGQASPPVPGPKHRKTRVVPGPHARTH